MSSILILRFILVFACIHTSVSYVAGPIQRDDVSSTTTSSVPSHHHLQNDPDCVIDSYGVCVTINEYAPPHSTTTRPPPPPRAARIPQKTYPNQRNVGQSDSSKVHFPSDDIDTRQQSNFPPYQTDNRPNIIKGHQTYDRGNGGGQNHDQTVNKLSEVLVFFDGPSSNPGGRQRQSSFPTDSPIFSTTTSETPAACECPVTPEFNPVCGEMGEEKERVTFRNLSELQCAAFCTKTNVKLLFHSGCRPIITKLSILQQYVKNN